MIKIEVKKENKIINYPTSYKEVNIEELIKYMDDVVIPKHYALIAIGYKVKLFELVNVNSKSQKVSIKSILIKGDENDCKERNINIGQALIIPPSYIERGVHVNTNLSISYSNTMRIIKEYNDIKTNILNHKYTMESSILSKINDDRIIIFEFKIVPMTDIYGAIKDNVIKYDPFVTPNIENNNN